jgi:hypothetical protein
MESQASGFLSKARAFITETKSTFDQPGSSYLMPALFVIGLLVVIGIIVYIFMQKKKNAPITDIVGPIDLFKPQSPVVIDRKTAAAAMTSSYTLAFYVRFDAVPDMRTTATALMQWAGIWSLGYIPSQEELSWTFQQTRDSTSPATPETFTTPGVPLQRWTQIAIGFEGRSVDIYVNGTLVASRALNNVPPNVASSITLTPGGIMGQIAGIQLWPRRLTVNEISSNYSDTSDSQGRPNLGPAFFKAISNVNVPNLFCPSGDCNNPKAKPSQTWDFPYQ